ncbi:PLP-dependent transferase [Gonapodya prolifera JEL478]|uniref:sphinganine-1-phosphate aldolase n=1 Tax=Gonapodya prolifera (strain JEL478) TaxID=1344416 RepID=A0A139AWM7_GONPJ|nr:PLP-dependent transferase [Gonapodya prolifera JEL478]|eukprot:KXS21109.1 PLP-dependent transferase [Gonapodya prolifera JEL478]
MSSALVLYNSVGYRIARDAIFWLVLLKYGVDAVDYVTAHGGIRETVLYAYKTLPLSLGRYFYRIFGRADPLEVAVSAAAARVAQKVAPSAFDQSLTHYTQLPTKGLGAERVIAELLKYKSRDSTTVYDGKVSGGVYSGEIEGRELAAEAVKMFIHSNPLHPSLFESTRAMEAEVVSMVLHMFNAPPDAGGVLTSGGSESLLMAVKAYRDWARDVKGITKPNIVVPLTLHPAVQKATEFFSVQIRKVDIDPTTLKVDLGAMERAIDRNTIAIFGSLPNYPYGVCDPIPALGALAQKYGIGLHIDACLGGFVIAFMDKAGFGDGLKKDLGWTGKHGWGGGFEVEGVTSISCDTHKYGFAPKGTSTILYRSSELRRYQYSVETGWPGGLYASHGVLGSRPGALIAGCWAVLMKNGEDGYINSSREIVNTARRIAQGLNKIPGIQVMGNPIASVVAWRSVDPLVDISEVGHTLNKRGWHLGSLQLPSALHFSVTLITARAVDQLLADTAEAVKAAREMGKAAVARGEKPKSNTTVVYGGGSVVEKAVAAEMAKVYLDSIYKAAPTDGFTVSTEDEMRETMSKAIGKEGANKLSKALETI